MNILSHDLVVKFSAHELHALHGLLGALSIADYEGLRRSEEDILMLTAVYANLGSAVDGDTWPMSNAK